MFFCEEWESCKSKKALRDAERFRIADSRTTIYVFSRRRPSVSYGRACDVQPVHGVHWELTCDHGNHVCFSACVLKAETYEGSLLVDFIGTAKIADSSIVANEGLKLLQIIRNQSNTNRIPVAKSSQSCLSGHFPVSRRSPNQPGNGIVFKIKKVS